MKSVKMSGLPKSEAKRVLEVYKGTPGGIGDGHSGKMTQGIFPQGIFFFHIE